MYKWNPILNPVNILWAANIPSNDMIKLDIEKNQKFLLTNLLNSSNFLIRLIAVSEPSIFFKSLIDLDNSASWILISFVLGGQLVILFNALINENPL